MPVQQAMVTGQGRDGSSGALDETADGALLAATARGELEAFERLHRRFHGRLFGFALRLIQRHDMAEEVAVDTLLAVWRQAAQFRGESRPSTWIFGIAYRLCLKAGKRAGRDALHSPIDEDLPAARSGTEEVETLFLRRRVTAALRRLPIEQRATVELTYYHGYRLSEIAEITGCPVGTVKTRMFHARAKLRALLEGEAR